MSLPYTKMPSDSNRKQLCPQATSVLTAHTLWDEKSRLDAASSKMCLRCGFCISCNGETEGCGRRAWSQISTAATKKKHAALVYTVFDDVSIYYTFKTFLHLYSPLLCSSSSSASQTTSLYRLLHRTRRYMGHLAPSLSVDRNRKRKMWDINLHLTTCQLQTKTWLTQKYYQTHCVAFISFTLHSSHNSVPHKQCHSGRWTGTACWFLGSSLCVCRKWCHLLSRTQSVDH